MFTGIIEHVGRIASVSHDHGGSSLVIDLGPLVDGARIGDSIACDGVCLTVTRFEGSLGSFDVSPETRRKTTLGGWGVGRRLNLERALQFGDRLGGHLVSGHVDGVGRLLERRREGDSERFTILLPEDGSVQVVEKGSLSIDGISLTTWDCHGQRASIAVIPHTLTATTLADRRPGDPLNLEQDLIGRWVERMLAVRGRHG
jgi:riboflavin synthase